MADISSLSNEELLRLAGKSPQSSVKSDISSVSDEDLLAMLNRGNGEQKQAQMPPSPAQGGEMQGILESIMQGGAGVAAAKKGVMDFLSGAGKLGAKGIDYLAGTHLEGMVPEYEPSEIEKLLMKGSPKTAAVGEFAGGALPAMMLPGGQLKMAEEAISAAPEALQGALRLLGKGLKGAGVGAAVAPVYAPDEDVLSSMKKGAEFGAAGPLAEKAIGSALGLGKKGGQKLLAGLLGGTHAPEKIEKNIKALENIGADEKMPLGEIIGSPHLKSVSGVLSVVPGTRQARNYMDVGKSIKGAVSDVLNEIKPGKSEKVSENLISDLSKGRQSVLTESNKKYSDLEKMASKSGVKVSKDSMSNEASNIASKIKSDSVFGKYSDDADIKSILEKVQEKESSAAFGTRLKKDMSFSDAFSLRRKINDSIKNTPFDDRRKKSLLMGMKKSLDSDLESSASQSGNKEIIAALKDANKHYSDKVAPLNKKEIVGFTDLGEDPDKFIPAFLKTGQYSRDNLLNKVAEHLSQKNKGKLAHQYLTRKAKEVGGELKIKEGEILNEYSRLPNNAKNKLFTKAQREKLDSALTVKEMAGGDLHQMLNPKTGKMWEKAAGLASAAGVVPPVVGNLATRLMKNPELRKKYLEAIKSGKAESLDIDFGTLSKLGVPLGMSATRSEEK
jgi:hypothetical protein